MQSSRLYPMKTLLSLTSRGRILVFFKGPAEGAPASDETIDKNRGQVPRHLRDKIVIFL